MKKQLHNLVILTKLNIINISNNINYNLKIKLKKELKKYLNYHQNFFFKI